MNQLLISFVLLAVAVAALHAQTTADLTSCLSANWIQCGLSVGTGIYQSLHSWNDYQPVNAFGTQCNTQVKGGFYRWKWVWDAHFQCPSISPTLQGTSSAWKSRNGAVEHAIQNYVTQAGQHGLLTKEQIANWQGKSG